VGRVTEISESDCLSFCSAIFPSEPLAETLKNEARFGLSRLLPILSHVARGDADVLEVGGGSCVLSAYLASKGYRVTAVEPLAGEFDFFNELHGRVADHCRRAGVPLQIVRATGETFALPGQFDVAFTINALEHMREPLRTIDNICESLRPGGVALLHCPNYTIPFEMHLNILLVTRSKRINEWLYWPTIAQRRAIWDELTFIRHGDVQRHLRSRGDRFSFNRTVMRDLVARLFDDPVFAGRMPGFVRAAGRALRATRLVDGLALVPARFQTPMEVLITKASA